MKLKLNMFHKAAIIMLILGLTITAVGLVMFVKYINIKDVSELGEGEDKDGVYVKGKIQRLIYVNEDGSTRIMPAAVYAGDSPTGKSEGVFVVVLTDLAHNTGKYIPLGIDQYTFPEAYQYIFGATEIPEVSGTDIVVDGQFEGILCTNKEYTDKAREFADLSADQYKYVVIDGEIISDFKGDKISDCYIEIKDLTARRYLWLIGLPPLLGGLVLAFIAGSPFKRVK